MAGANVAFDELANADVDERANADVDERARNMFSIGGSSMDLWHDSRARVALGHVASFLASRSPLSVILDAESSEEGGLSVSIRALNGSCKTTLLLPRVVCSLDSWVQKSLAKAATADDLREGDTCLFCRAPIIKEVVSEQALARATRAVIFPCGALYHEACYESLVHNGSFEACPACPSASIRATMARIFGISFIALEDLSDWLELRLPTDFCANAFIQSECIICGDVMVSGLVSRPYPCDCFAHESCTRLARVSFCHVRECAGCKASAWVRASSPVLRLYRPVRQGARSIVRVGADAVMMDE